MYEIRVLSEKWDKLSYFESRIWLILSKHIKMFSHCLKNENRDDYYLKRTMHIIYAIWYNKMPI